MIARKPLFIALAFALASGAAFAKRGPHWPSSYDANGDGQITQAEVQTARTTEFTAIDTDSDGYAKLAELQTWLANKQTTDYNALNTDGGTLSQTEFAGDRADAALTISNEIFTLADTDGDGGLSLDEFKALRPVFAESIHHFVMMDADHDGKISLSEYTTPPKRGKGGKGGPGGEGPGGPGGHFH